MAEIMKEQAQEASVLDALLGATVPNVEKDLPTARYKVDRLSQAAGRDVVFTLRALPYGKVHDLERFNQDADIHILLAGCVEPDLKDPGCWRSSAEPRRPTWSSGCCWPVRSRI